MENYIEGHRKSGIKVGDKVRVTRKAENHEGGWCEFWVKPMNRFVGEEVLVTKDHEESGFYCGEGFIFGTFNFPYFVLEKI